MSRVRLGDVVQRIKDPVDKDNTDLIYYVGGEHFTNRAFKVTNKGLIKGSTIGPAFNTKFKSGDVLLMSRNPHLRKAGMVEFDGICSDVSYVIRTKDENVLMQRFIPLLFQTDMFWEFAEKNKKGSTNFFLNWKDFEQFEFELPEMEKQSKLVEMLWSMVDTMDSYEEMLLKQDELIKSQFIEMFEGKYNKKPIKFFIDTNIISVKKRFNLNDTIRYVDIASVDNLRNTVTSYTEYVVKSAPSRAQQCLLNGDILVSLVRPNLKNIAVFSKKGDNYVASSGFCVLRSLKASSRYLLQCVLDDSFTREMVNLTNGANYPAVRNSDVLNYLIFDAPVEKQVEFNEIANQIDKSKFEIEKSLTELKLLFQRIVKEQLEN